MWLTPVKQVESSKGHRKKAASKMRQKDQDRKHIKAYFSFKFIKDEIFYRNTYQKLKCYLSFSSSFSSLLEEGLCGNSLKSLFDCFLFSFFTEMNIKKINKTLHWAEHILTHRFYYAIQHFWGPSVWEDCVLPRSAILLPTVVFSDILITPAVIGIFFFGPQMKPSSFPAQMKPSSFPAADLISGMIRL